MLASAELGSTAGEVQAEKERTFQCLSVSCRGMGQQWPAQGQGLLLQQTWKALHVSLTWSHQADNPQAGEQFYQRNSHTVMEVLGPTTDFPTWGSGKGTETPQGI